MRPWLCLVWGHTRGLPGIASCSARGPRAPWRPAQRASVRCRAPRFSNRMRTLFIPARVVNRSWNPRRSMVVILASLASTPAKTLLLGRQRRLSPVCRFVTLSAALENCLLVLHLIAHHPLAVRDPSPGNLVPRVVLRRRMQKESSRSGNGIAL